MSIKYKNYIVRKLLRRTKNQYYVLNATIGHMLDVVMYPMSYCALPKTGLADRA